MLMRTTPTVLKHSMVAHQVSETGPERFTNFSTYLCFSGGVEVGDERLNVEVSLLASLRASNTLN